MRLFNLMIGFASLCLLYSCTSDVIDPGIDVQTVRINKGVEFYAFSNGNALSHNIVTRAGGVEDNNKVVIKNDENIRDGKSESIQVNSLENKGQNDLKNENWSCYWDWRDKSPKRNGSDESVSNDEKNKVLDWLRTHKDDGVCEFPYAHYFTQFVNGSNNMAQIMVNGSHEIFQTYNDNSGNRLLVVNTPIADASYWGSGGAERNNRYRFYCIDESYYLCFDFEQKSSNGNGVVLANGIYDDYVIKLIPVGYTIENCNDEFVSDVVKKDTGSVEINLHLQDHTDWWESKLSVHVRDTVDFEVVLDIDKELYIAQDDLYIVKKHIEDGYAYKVDKNKQSIDYVIDGNVVTLSCEYTEANIMIRSNGINANMLKYLRKKYGDGITFEIHNYYNIYRDVEKKVLVTKEELEKCLDMSTVKFTNETEYINVLDYKDSKSCYRVVTDITGK